MAARILPCGGHAVLDHNTSACALSAARDFSDCAILGGPAYTDRFWLPLRA